MEFKSTYHWDPDKGRAIDERRLAILRAIAGFLNADGGTLFIGVQQDNSGQANVRGLREDLELASNNQDELRLRLASQIADRIGSQFSRFVTDRIEQVNGKHCWVVEVKGGPEPAYVRWDKGKRFCVREGPRTSDLDIETAHRYIKNKWG